MSIDMRFNITTKNFVIFVLNSLTKTENMKQFN